MKSDSGGAVRLLSIQPGMFLAAFIIVLIGALHIGPVYRFIGGRVVLWIYDLTNVVTALVGTWLASLLWRSFRRGETLSLISGCLTIGLAMDTAGEVIWSSDQLLFGNNLPYPSAADVLWIGAYLPVILALGVRLYTFQMRFTRPSQHIILGAFFLGVILALVYVILPILRDTEAGSPLEKLINVLYPVGDLAVAFFALSLILVLSGGLLFGPWGWIALGCFSFAISDLLYASAVWQGLYQVESVSGLDFMSYSSNLLYTAAYVLVALGLYQMGRLENVV
jgi:hypothetical protein